VSANFAANPNAVREFVLDEIEGGRSNLAKSIQDRFHVSRPTAHNYLRRLIDSGDIARTGQGQYELVHEIHELSFLVNGLEEDRVWSAEIEPLLSSLPQSIRDIWHYGCTEMINNVIDHSHSEVIEVLVDKTARSTRISVSDSGIGIFRKIASALKLEDDRHAVVELAKGKVTTDPANHTGEGIFFSSRVFDHYLIVSGDVLFTHDTNSDHDWIFGGEEPKEEVRGTIVIMELRNSSNRKLQDVFDQYATDTEDYRFDKTIVPIRLMTYGDDRLVSRSQAKRLLSRIDRFRHVILDFDGVDAIGQAFADEIFRVFAGKHPEIEIVAIQANEQISRMINRAIR
jgi:anti-sigma regulatory factor (Ser/Thr protein kinase)